MFSIDAKALRRSVLSGPLIASVLKHSRKSPCSSKVRLLASSNFVISLILSSCCQETPSIGAFLTPMHSKATHGWRLTVTGGFWSWSHMFEVDVALAFVGIVGE